MALAIGSFAAAWAPPPKDLQTYCESLARNTTVRAPLRSLSARIERTIALPGDARLWSAQWNPREKTLSVLEGTESRITVLDSVGNVVRTIGRRGDGPGEFRLSPVYTGSRQKFRFAEDGRVLALDDRYGHVFSKGRETQDVRLGDLAGVLVTDAHVARITEGWIVSQAYRRAPDAAARSLVRLYLIRDEGGPHQVAPQVGSVRNVLSQSPPATGRSVDMPYDDMYRRTWDAAGQHIAVLSYRSFSICAGGVADSSSWRAWSVNALPREVTATEKNRVLTQRFGAATGPIPVMGGRIEDFYEGRWPQVAPFYYDLTSLNDSKFAALRLDNEGGVTADLIGVRSGYRGSVKIPASRSVIGAYADGLMLLNYGDAEIEFLRLPAG